MHDPLYAHSPDLLLAIPPVDEVHLWTTFLSRAAVVTGDPESGLSPAERRRAAGIAAAADRARFVAGRALLRAILGRYLEDGPLEIESDRQGKPRLGSGAFEFSVAHAGGLLAVAISRSAVGVDLEPASAAARIAPLATGFTPRERAALDCREKEARRRALVTLWCAKEAVGKLSGEGLARGLDAHDVLPLLDRPVARIAGEAGPLALHRREPLPGYTLVVAALPPVRRVVARRF